MGFNVDFLKVQRDYEYDVVKNLLFPGAKILEIGAGAGFQSKRFSEDGFVVNAIDVISSNYETHQVYPIQNYDGVNIPFPTKNFDFVFTSSVLEHVYNLPELQQEIKRVLKSEGKAIHVLPSAVWRFWTIFSGYCEGIRELSLFLLGQLNHKKFNRREFINKWTWLKDIYFLPKRHGELGNVFSEIYYFSRFYWCSVFKKQGFKIHQILPAGLFYTGNMFLGKRMSIKARKLLGALIGSACSIYILIPNDHLKTN